MMLSFFLQKYVDLLLLFYILNFLHLLLLQHQTIALCKFLLKPLKIKKKKEKNTKLTLKFSVTVV